MRKVGLKAGHRLQEWSLSHECRFLTHPSTIYPPFSREANSSTMTYRRDAYSHTGSSLADPCFARNSQMSYRRFKLRTYRVYASHTVINNHGKIQGQLICVQQITQTSYIKAHTSQNSLLRIYAHIGYKLE